MTEIRAALDAALEGGPERHRRKVAEQEKLPVRERVERLLDSDTLVEDGLLANWEQEGLGADGVVTGMGTIAGRPVALMANDPAVKAGSWGPKTVEKILRVQERALTLRIPIVYLVDCPGFLIGPEAEKRGDLKQQWDEYQALPPRERQKPAPKKKPAPAGQ